MGTRIQFARPDGGQTDGYLALSGPGRPGLVVIQEWWGLNDQICGVADRFARAGYNALVTFRSIRSKLPRPGSRGYRRLAAKRLPEAPPPFFHSPTPMIRGDLVLSLSYAHNFPRCPSFTLRFESSPNRSSPVDLYLCHG